MDTSAAQSGLAFLHQYHQKHPLDLDDDRFVRLHEWFLHELSTIDRLNHVVPKRPVLEQIARSASVRQVVVREPIRGGELLAESVRPHLPSVFVVDAAGLPADSCNTICTFVGFNIGIDAP